VLEALTTLREIDIENPAPDELASAAPVENRDLERTLLRADSLISARSSASSRS